MLLDLNFTLYYILLHINIFLVCSETKKQIQFLSTFTTQAAQTERIYNIIYIIYLCNCTSIKFLYINRKVFIYVICSSDLYIFLLKAAFINFILFHWLKNCVILYTWLNFFLCAFWVVCFVHISYMVLLSCTNKIYFRILSKLKD